MALQKKKKKTMSPARQAVAALSGILYLVFAVMAFRDIRKRSPEEINGNKKFWMVSVFMATNINGVSIPLAPLAYFLFGRKR
jgi:hypothetical protein